MGASTRNRARQLSNKARLKVVHGDLEIDSLYIPDEDDEKNHLADLAAGVDAEDANEHHLQAVLAANHQNHANGHGSTRGAGDKHAPPSAYIPTPDSTGIVDNYADLYPPNRWKDPVTYLHSSITAEESCSNAIALGFTYYMDERDKEWLDRNNEEARGEGTSAQGAISASATRTSARSAKAKGKEPESSHALVISEDEFELTMGLFEKVTHEKTEYLHHALETGMAFPTFNEYQDTFSSPLPPPTFASYSVPTWVPAPAHLVRIARAIYPHWKERRIERGGHRIIPTLNNDEADVLNESYVCFRMRELKTVRKTRASQASSSDKLARLQSEFAYPLELAKHILQREQLKRDCTQHARQILDKRIRLAALKKKYPSLGDKADEELLIDKEKPKKTETSRAAKARTESGTPVRPDVIAMRPAARVALIKEAVEARLNLQKEQDHHWEDQVDNPYQPLPVSYPSRLFKYIPVNFLASSSDNRQNPESERVPRAVRTRRGRGGRLLVDRRDCAPRPIVSTRPSSSLQTEADDVELKAEDAERKRRLEERWRFDADDIPPLGPDGPEEQNRVIVDDYSPKLLRHSMTLFLDQDQQGLVNDASIPVINDGRQQLVVPFRLGIVPPLLRRLPHGAPRAGVPQAYQKVSPVASIPNGTPISMQQQLKKMPPPIVPQTRISSNGGMRPPQVVPSMQSPSSQPSASSSVTQSHLSLPISNGVNRAAINMPHVDGPKVDVNGAQSSLSSATQPFPQADPNRPHNPKSNNAALPHNLPQGVAATAYHLTSQAAAALANPMAYQGNHGLSMQQVQNLKSAFANAQAGHDSSALKGLARALPSYIQAAGASFNIQQLAAASNINLKLPTARQMQWTPSTPPAKAVPVANGVDGQRVNGSVSSNATQVVPARTPSANGTRPVVRMGSNGQFAGQPSPQLHSPSPISGAISQSQSPPRVPLTPTLPKESPSLQHQQGSSKSGH
ncbi:putative enhancer of polycomb-like protein [Lyophyllum shimeji]|uniref:Enhancer of polycomb-like protein n=1 Tax=Lyophyllum shimeji TaxID=47721 RepID=A0A9P3PKH1_LYOSH|nr:putative enhancer of polycomb-like protein [Lyophyllum shimeji]